MSIVKKVFWGIVFVIVLFVGIGLLLPGKRHVERSTTVAATPAQVYTLVDGFRRFNEWSPWFDLDPAARYVYSGPDHGVGARMEWKSDKRDVGAGSQEVLAVTQDREVRVRLTFVGQGNAVTVMSLAPEGSGTRVTWGFDIDLGLNPVARWLGTIIDRSIGADYDKGLARLKVLAEKEATAAPR